MKYVSEVRRKTANSLEKDSLRIINHFGLLLEKLPEDGARGWQTRATFLECPYWRLNGRIEVKLQLSMSQASPFLPVMLCLQVFEYLDGETVGVYTLQLYKNRLEGVFSEIYVGSDETRLTPEDVLFIFQTVAEAGAGAGIPRFQAYLYVKEKE